MTPMETLIKERIGDLDERVAELRANGNNWPDIADAISTAVGFEVSREWLRSRYAGATA